MADNIVSHYENYTGILSIESRISQMVIKRC